jgi:hypothetical protein
MEYLWTIESDVFKHPFTCMIAGPTQSGKTSLITQILFYNQLIINPQPSRIIYCYKTWQSKYDEMRKIWPTIQFEEGLIDMEQLDPNQNNVVIIDDYMQEGEKSSSILELFTVNSHHKNISVFFLTQNLFSQGKHSRSISLNCHYLIVFNNPRDRMQINVLARQMFPNRVNFFMEAFEDAMETRTHGYIFLDFKQSTETRNRVQTGIIPGDQRLIYTPIKEI